MRPIAAILAIFLSLAVTGCHSNQQPVPVVTTGRSLADMETEYAKLRERYLADCVNGTPQHVHDNQPLCDVERKKMAPLGNAITEAEVNAAQHPKNP